MPPHWAENGWCPSFVLGLVLVAACLIYFVVGWRPDWDKGIALPIKSEAKSCSSLSLENASVVHIPHKDCSIDRKESAVDGAIWQFLHRIDLADDPILLWPKDDSRLPFLSVSFRWYISPSL